MVVTAMTELISRYGPPMSTLTDNGLVFTTRLARFKGARGGFEKLIAAHGITQKNGRPGHPQTQGKICEDLKWCSTGSSLTQVKN